MTLELQPIGVQFLSEQMETYYDIWADSMHHAPFKLGTLCGSTQTIVDYSSLHRSTSGLLQ